MKKVIFLGIFCLSVHASWYADHHVQPINSVDLLVKAFPEVPTFYQELYYGRYEDPVRVRLSHNNDEKGERDEVSVDVQDRSVIIRAEYVDFVSEKFTVALKFYDLFKNVRQESFVWSIAPSTAHALGTITLFPCLKQPKTWDPVIERSMLRPRFRSKFESDKEGLSFVVYPFWGEGESCCLCFVEIAMNFDDISCARVAWGTVNYERGVLSHAVEKGSDWVRLVVES